MFFACNSSHKITFETTQLGKSDLKKVEIKKGKKANVEGLTKIKQTDQKKQIVGYELQSPEDQPAKQKYHSLLGLFGNQALHCLGPIFNSKLPMKVCLLCLNICHQIPITQHQYIKFLLNDLHQRSIKTLLALTHLDKYNHLSEDDRALQTEMRIGYFKEQLNIKDRNDIFCVENYRFSRYANTNVKTQLTLCQYSTVHTVLQNNQQINYISLTLLQTIIKEVQRYNSLCKNAKTHKYWFCG